MLYAAKCYWPGISPMEFRSRPTRIVWERLHIYASNRWAAGKLSDAAFLFPALNSDRRVGIYPAA